MMLKLRPHRNILYKKRFSPQLSWVGLLALVTLWTALLAGCAGFGGSNPSPTGPAVTELDNEVCPKGLHIKGGETVTWVNKGQTTVLHVPEEYATVQAAVNAARAGDMISIAPGIYHEAVTVRTPDLIIRGRDRNRVIMDGIFKLGNAFEVVEGADGVVIENMTARHYSGNGFYWEGVKGFRGSYLTAYANGDYGIYAYGSNTGQFDPDLAAGHPDSGFYIRDFHPRHANITPRLPQHNAPRNSR